MKFYQASIAFTLLLYSFSSTPMDNQQITKGQSRIADLHHCIIEMQQSLDLVVNNQQHCNNKKRPGNTDKDGFLKNQEPGTFQELFLEIPRHLQKHFQPTHLIAQNEKKIARKSTKKKAEQAAQMVLVNDILKKEATVKAFTEKNNALRKQFDEKEKLLIAQKKEIELKKQEIAEPKKIVSQKLPVTEKIKKNNAPPTTQEHRNALKSLMSQCKAREKDQLKTKLVDLCDDIWYRRCENNQSEGPYFNSNLHMIYGQINCNWSYIFYPCKSQVATVKHSYAEIVGNIEKFLNPNLICDQKCNYYVSKCKKIESYSSTETSDMEMCSESD